jgi:polyisoprenoid-binding protein YceI
MSINDYWRLGLFPLTLSGVLLGLQSRQTIGVSAADPIVYRLVPASRFEVRTGKSGLFGFAGHSHEVRARAVDGWVVYNAEHPTSSRVEVRVPAESLQVLTPPDTAEMRKVTERMQTEVLQVSRYPEIRFTPTVAAPASQGFKLNGELTMAGHTRPVPVDVAVRMAGDTLWAEGKFSAKQTDFGIKPVTAGPGGAVKVADEVKFEIAAVAVRDPAAQIDNAGVPIARAAQ